MQGIVWERGIAATVALVINAVAVWAIAIALRPPKLPDPADVVLQAVWITRAPPRVAASAVQGSGPRTAAKPVRRSPTPAFEPRDDALPPIDALTTEEPAGGRPLSAVYLAQARQHAQAAEPFAADPDPLANRAVRLPGKAAGTFRMRPPGSPARVVVMVGMLFGGNDPKEPCNSNRARIADLGTAGDSERLQQELDFERRWCRP